MGKLGLQKGSLQGILHISKSDNIILLLIRFIHNVYDISYMSIGGVSEQIHVWYKNKHMS